MACPTWQKSPLRYSETGPLLPLLPTLIRDVEGAVRARGRDHRQANQITADLYFLLRNSTKRIGRTDLALLEAGWGVRAAEDTDDPLRIAAAQWNVGHALLATNEAEAAEDIAIHAVEELDLVQRTTTDAPRTALRGALWLVATIAAIRNNDDWTARARLREKAWAVARQAGEGNVFWMVFGPTNVSIHAVTIEMEAGETAQALHLADEIDIACCLSVERCATFALELANAYEQRREDSGVPLHLLDVEREAREDMRPSRPHRSHRLTTRAPGQPEPGVRVAATTSS